MKTFLGGALIKEKEHNDDKYKIEINEYTVSPDERFCNVVCEVTVKMKFLFFWITIWKEFINGNEFKTIDDYNNEVDYVNLKAEDILEILTD